MNAVPWWGPSLLALGGTLLGAVATLSISLLNRRTERRRLARDEKVAAYPELLAAATRLADLAVWPAGDDPHGQLADIERLVARIAFFAPPKVGGRLAPVLHAATDLATLVSHIRAASEPGHGGRIDQRLAPQHATAVEQLRQATTAFTTAARADLEINTPYTPVDTDSDVLDTISKPGAGSREPGAGSREPLGRRPLLCHAG
jgi:hypothetical protein